MAPAVIGVVVPNVEIADAATVSKTFPDFVAEWTRFVSGEST
jgi:5-enolpyruvylshikimate-3-phosphate synthase